MREAVDINSVIPNGPRQEMAYRAENSKGVLAEQENCPAGELASHVEESKTQNSRLWLPVRAFMMAEEDLHGEYISPSHVWILDNPEDDILVA